MYLTYPGGTRLIARGQLQVWQGLEVGKEWVISGFAVKVGGAEHLGNTDRRGRWPTRER